MIPREVVKTPTAHKSYHQSAQSREELSKVMCSGHGMQQSRFQLLSAYNYTQSKTKQKTKPLTKIICYNFPLLATIFTLAKTYSYCDRG